MIAPNWFADERRFGRESCIYNYRGLAETAAPPGLAREIFLIRTQSFRSAKAAKGLC